MSKQTKTWLAVVLLVLAAGAGVWLWQRQQNDDEVARLNERVAQLQDQAERLADTLEAGDQAGGTEELSQQDENQTPVVFDPPGRFSGSLQQELTTSIIEPHELYQSDQDQSVAAYYIRETQVANEYAVTAIFAGQNNAYESFLVGGEDGINWTPTCLDECEFSQEFREAYSDIVERAQTQ